MANQEDLAKLFFELASDTRLNILNELNGKELKMQEVARLLDVTATEAFRQLERLSGALLIARQPEGTYTLTPYGKVMLQLSTSMRFILKHRIFFSTHNVSALPYQFLNRIGELSKSALIVDTMESLNKGQRVFIEMERYGWGIAEGVIPELMGHVMDQQVQKGIKMKFIIPEAKLPSKPLNFVNVEIRGLAEIPAIIAVNEKEALLCLCANSGKIDYSAFHGTDPVFVNWTKDFFLYYWDKAKRI